MIRKAHVLERLRDPGQRRWLVEAGAGFGKTALLEDLRRVIVEPVLVVRPPIVSNSALSLYSELADAANRAGEPEIAASILGSEGSLPGIAGAIASSQVALVFDDVHEWDESANASIRELCERLDGRVLVVVAGRSIRGALAELRSSPVWRTIGATELAFTVDETRECLIEQGAPADAAEVIYSASDGWPLAVALGAARLAESADAGAVARELAGYQSLIDGLLDRYLADFDATQTEALATLVALPFFDARVASMVAKPGLLDELVAGGLPITQRVDGWFEFSGQLRSAMSRRGLRAERVPASITKYLVARGETHAAINACLALGRYADAAQVIAGLTNDQQARLEPSTINAAMTMIGEVAEVAPRSLLVQAQVNGTFGRMAEGLAALERSAAYCETRAPEVAPETRLEIMLELALWRIFEGRSDDANDLLDRSSGELSPGSSDLLFAKAHDVRGLLFQTQGNAEALERAATEFASSLSYWQRMGEPRPAAATVFRLAAGVLADLGRRSQALELLDNLPNVGPMTLINRARLGLERSILLPYLGRAHEVASVLEEPRRIARLLGHEWLIGWTYWAEIVAASFLGESERVGALLTDFENSGYVVVDERTQHGMWCEVAEALARCGLHERAKMVLQRVSGSELLPPWFLRYTESSVAARSDQPSDALAALHELAMDPAIDHDRVWRIELLRSYCYWSMGDRAKQAEHLQVANELVLAIGQPTLLEIAERQMLLCMATAYEEPNHGPAGVVEVTLFDEFGVKADGTAVGMPRGHGSDLVKLLVLGGGSLLIDQVVDPLWPDVSLEIGRRRLRNVLARVREVGREIIVRDGDLLRLAPEVSSDYGRAVTACNDALAQSKALGSLQNAIELMDRELLPADRYEPWAEDARATHVQRLLALLDAQAACAEQVGDVELTVDSLRKAHALDPLRSKRISTAAALLRSQGREAAAAALTAGE